MLPVVWRWEYLGSMRKKKNEFNHYLFFFPPTTWNFYIILSQMATFLFLFLINNKTLNKTNMTTSRATCKNNIKPIIFCFFTNKKNNYSCKCKSSMFIFHEKNNLWFCLVIEVTLDLCRFNISQVNFIVTVCDMFPT